MTPASNSVGPWVSFRKTPVVQPAISSLVSTTKTSRKAAIDHSLFHIVGKKLPLHRLLHHLPTELRSRIGMNR